MNRSQIASHRVLHITPHLGGGVGRVLLNYLAATHGNPDFSHSVISLEYANEMALSASQRIGFPLQDKMSAHHDLILTSVAKADIVLIHWWNHPLLFDFLVRETLPPARVCFWSHVSGFHAPYVFSEALLKYPDYFAFTTPLSLETAEVAALRESRGEAFRVIWATGGVDHVAQFRPRPHEGFKIGYVGTVDYCKMHPDFLSMSSAIRIPNAEFIVCGGPNEEQLRRDSLRYRRGNRFIFTGKVSDIPSYLSQFDVFGYPLAPYHYGTCEQSLGESMAAGIPPVVFDNPAERLIVESEVTGIIVKSARGYSEAIETLYRNPELRQRLSANARKASQTKFAMPSMVRNWEETFGDMLCIPKVRRRWAGAFHGNDISPAHVFLESLGRHGEPFRIGLTSQDCEGQLTAKVAIQQLAFNSHIWKSSTKGTPSHYHQFFPHDDNLRLWHDYIVQCIGTDDPGYLHD